MYKRHNTIECERAEVEELLGGAPRMQSNSITPHAHTTTTTTTPLGSQVTERAHIVWRCLVCAFFCCSLSVTSLLRLAGLFYGIQKHARSSVYREHQWNMNCVCAQARSAILLTWKIINTLWDAHSSCRAAAAKRNRAVMPRRAFADQFNIFMRG